MGSTARPRYIGLREILERDILELYCNIFHLWRFSDCCICTQTIVGWCCMGTGPEFCEQSRIYNGLTPYDVVMKTADVELSCHMNIDLQAGIYGTEIGNEL